MVPWTCISGLEALWRLESLIWGIPTPSVMCESKCHKRNEHGTQRDKKPHTYQACSERGSERVVGCVCICVSVYEDACLCVWERACVSVWKSVWRPESFRMLWESAGGVLVHLFCFFLHPRRLLAAASVCPGEALYPGVRRKESGPFTGHSLQVWWEGFW